MTDRARQVLTSLRENWRTIGKLLGTIVLILVVAPFIAHVYPGLVGADHSFIVISGSMEPNIPVGSITFVESDVSVENIEEGDVITFTKGRNTRTTTHRVYEKHVSTVDDETSISFTTKGDANENPDVDRVYRNDVVGKLMFSIPLIGYVISFAGTDVGWVALVIVPVFLLMLDGMWTLWKAIDFEDGENS